MTLEYQKQEIRTNHPIPNEALFINNKTVCIVPQDWWTNWYSYVGYYGVKSGPHPGPLDTSKISLTNTYNHIYIAKVSWKIIKSCYTCSKKIEVFVVNKRPDLYLIEILIVPPDGAKKLVKLSPNLKVHEIKAYLCQKFKLDSDWHKLVIKKSSGFSNSLKNVYEKLDPIDLTSCELHLVKTNKVQKAVEEEQIMVESINTPESTGYPSPFQDFDAETVRRTFHSRKDANRLKILGAVAQDPNEGMDSTGYYSPYPEVEHIQMNIDIDYEAVRTLNSRILQILQGERYSLKLKSLKTLQDYLKDINETLDSLGYAEH